MHGIIETIPSLVRPALLRWERDNPSPKGWGIFILYDILTGATSLALAVSEHLYYLKYL